MPTIILIAIIVLSIALFVLLYIASKIIKDLNTKSDNADTISYNRHDELLDEFLKNRFKQ